MNLRIEWLKRLIGPVKAGEIRSDLTKATGAADAAGLERKAVKEDNKPPEEQAPDGEQNPPPAPAEGDPVHEASMKLAQQVFDVKQGNIGTLTVEELASVIEEALRPAVEGETQQENQPMSENQQEVTQQDGEQKAVSQSEVGPGSTTTTIVAPEPEAENKALGLIESMVRDQAEIAKNFADQAETLEELKAIKPLVEQLVADMEKLKEERDQRPRSASEDDATVLRAPKGSDAEKALKKVERDVKKGVDGNKTILGGLKLKE